MSQVLPDRASPAERATVSPVRRRLLIGVGLVIAVGLGLAVATVLVNAYRPHFYAGTVLQGDDPAPGLDELSYADGTAVDLGAYRDEVVLVFFGYTNCPDVCPLTLSDAARAIELMDDDDAERTNLLMVSVDPERDDLETLQAYVEFFDPGFRGVGGPTGAIDRAATTYGVFYQLGEPDADGGYLVDHTGALMGIGPDGALRVLWSQEVGPEALAADIHELLS